MSDDQQKDVSVETKDNGISREEFDALSNKLTSALQENDKMRSHQAKLLDEKKTEQGRARDAEEAKLRDKGDWKQLHTALEEKNTELKSQLDDMADKSKRQSIGREAQKMAAELADGHNVNLMANVIKDRLKFSNGELRVLKEDGDLSVMSMSELKSEVQGDERFKSLLRGSKASGSGAIGSGDGVPSVNEMKRADWDKLDVVSKSEFFSKTKGKLID